MRTAIWTTALLLVGMVGPARAEVPTVLTPPFGEPAYRIAGDAFADLWQQVTGQRPPVAVAKEKATPADLPAGDYVLIGSDAVQPVLHALIRQATIESLGIRYGTDEYRLWTVVAGPRRFVVVAGGAGRSTLYAVYDFFRRQAGAEYFWDGDRIPKQPSIELAGIDVTERPRFDYRGLRYFAHRGLHRFQAEHWDLDDWKREIDWVLKKRFNLFMLRTGIDDLFQRAFPELPYPPIDAKDPDGVDRSYDDRTSFWQLRYRGELRKAVLQYARERGLLHPEDTGTITHWYSHTPSSFYEKHPDFPVIRDQKTGYKLATAQIWDIEDQRAWDAYWKLTQTHIDQFGQPRLFHTIGMAERTFGSDPRDNLQRKLYVYRKTQQMLRERYPDAPLLIAGWDFIAWWKDPDVRRLLGDFNPNRTIIFDYTADDADKLTFDDWGLLGNFPWLFGIFHSYARNSDVHEDYPLLMKRLAQAAKDRHCLGLALWPEISHADTFLLEFLAANTWQPNETEPSAAVARFCRGRYRPELAAPMREVWNDFLVTAGSVHWSHSGPRWLTFGEPQFRLLNGSEFSTLTPQRMTAMQGEYDRMSASLTPAPAVLKRLAGMADAQWSNSQWQRDALDMGRTVANRTLWTALAAAAIQREQWRNGSNNGQRISQLADASRRTLDVLADLLALSDDFSMQASLARLGRAAPLGGVAPTINPHSEQTLKSNAENDYCRSHHYELVRHVYLPEHDVFWKWVLARVAAGDKSPWKRPASFTAEAKAIEDQFYARPLAEMAPQRPRSPAALAESLTRLADLISQVHPQK